MKPDGEHCSDMEEIEIDPSELFCQLGMLIVEGRLPEPSPKGRVEGPHCPPALGDHAVHNCQEYNAKCRQAVQLERQMLTLWRNRVPMCIEVLLFPDCEHGSHSAQQAEATAPSTVHNTCVMLEQWMLQVLPKRPSENTVSARVLLQALRSYLHFSQISAWLNQSHGSEPQNLVYRITPPGDFCTNSFSQQPDMHTFPVTLITRNTTIKITVNSLPRRPNIPHVVCKMGHGHNVDQQRTGQEQVLPSRPFAGARPKTLSVCGSLSNYPQHIASSASLNEPTYSPVVQRDMSRPRRVPPSNTMQQNQETEQQLPHKRLFVKDANESNICDYTGVNISTAMQLKQNQQQLQVQQQGKDGAKSNVSLTTQLESSFPKSPSCRINQKHSPRDTGFSCDKSPSSASSLKTIESPKVLMTLKSPGQGYFSKLGHISSDSDKESSGSSPDLDRYLKGLSQQIEPLSPSQMQVYLSSLVSSRTATPSPPPGGSPLSNKQATSTSHICYTKSTAVPASKSSLQKTHIAATDRHSEENGQQKSFSQIETSESNFPDGSKSTQNGSSQNGFQNFEKSTNGASVTNGNASVSNGAAGQMTKQSSSHGDGSSDHTTDKSDPVIFTLGESLDLKTDEKPKFLSVNKLRTRSVGGEYEQNACSLLFQQREEVKTSTVKSQPAPDYRPQFVRSPTDAPSLHQFAGFSKSSPLLKSLMAREFTSPTKEEMHVVDNSRYLVDTAHHQDSSGRHIPTPQEQVTFRRSLGSSTSMIFHSTTGLPLQSSPAPMKKITASGKFDFDCTLTNVKAIKNSLSCMSLDDQNRNEEGENNNDRRVLSSSAPASASNNNNALLGNFEESLLNGRIEPAGVIEGFTAEIGASGSFCPKHVTLPVTAFFFSLSDDNEPSPYLGHINLNSLKKRGYYVPKKGTVQVTLFNPIRTVVKMFVVVYDLSDMPPNCQTFLRQRSLYMPAGKNPDELKDQPSYLRYLIHLRFASSKSGKIYLHTDIRLIFARDKFEYDSRVANYELRSFTDAPTNPKFSPKR